MATNVKADGGAWKYSVRIDGAALAARARLAAQAAIPEIAEHIKAESNAIAPLREGTLIESSRSESDAANLRAIVSYNTVYARYQHFGTGFSHPNGRKALYLRSVMDNPATAQAVADIFARHLKDITGG